MAVVSHKSVISPVLVGRQSDLDVLAALLEESGQGHGQLALLVLNDMVTSRWILVHGLTGVAFLFIIPGLIGLYARIAEESGGLGLAGFLLALTGSVLNAGLLLLIESILLPAAASNPAFVELTDPSTAAYAGTFALPLFLASSVIAALGAVIFGSALLRSSDLPRFAVFCTIVGGVLFAAPVPPLPVIINLAGIVLLGIGLATIGYTLWRGTSPLAVRPKVVVGARS
jgi:hypothetical protein